MVGFVRRRDHVMIEALRFLLSEHKLVFRVTSPKVSFRRLALVLLMQWGEVESQSVVPSKKGIEDVPPLGAAPLLRREGSDGWSLRFRLRIYGTLGIQGSRVERDASRPELDKYADLVTSQSVNDVEKVIGLKRAINLVRTGVPR